MPIKMSLLISGPIDIDILTYNGIKLILLSDAHFSSEGICNMQCDNKSAPNTTCYTARGLIDKIINESKLKGQYVDVYLESYWPETFSKRQLAKAQRKRERQLGLRPPLTGERMSFYKHSLGLTIMHYADCLYNKKACYYDNARFHYVDVRPLKVLNFVLLNKIIHFCIDMIDSYPYVYIDKEDTLDMHLDYFMFNFLIKTFLNTPKFTESNLYTYYTFVINSDNFRADVESYLNLLLRVDEKYIEDTIKLLSYRYPEYTVDFITNSINAKIKSIFSSIQKTMLYDEHIVTRNIIINNVQYTLNIHRIRAQLLALELQGDSKRAESLEQFIYDKLKSIRPSNVIELFDIYDKHRINYVNTGKINKQSYTTFIHLSIKNLIKYDIVGVLMVDLYTLSRMFRKYPFELRNFNKSSAEHILPSYIIEYAGASHILNVIEYFMSIGASREVFNIIKKDQRCLDVPSAAFD